MPYNLDIKGWMFEEELQVIEQLAKQVMPNGVIVEVGSFCGKSTLAWAMNADSSVTIYAFDYFYEHIPDENGNMCNSWEEFKKNTEQFKNVISIRGGVPEDKKYTDSQLIDILFVDASHNNPNDWNIIQHFLPFVKSGGIVSGHDYSLYNTGDGLAFPDVNLNVHRLEEMFNQKAKVTNRLWYLVKP